MEVHDIVQETGIKTTAKKKKCKKAKWMSEEAMPKNVQTTTQPVANSSRDETTLPASWETYMQVKKQQLEPDMEQQTGSKSGKEYFKAV